jgi:hypothetical protein
MNTENPFVLLAELGCDWKTRDSIEMYLAKPPVVRFSGSDWGWYGVGQLVRVFNDHMKMFHLETRTNPEDLFKRYLGLEKNQLPSGVFWMRNSTNSKNRWLAECRFIEDFHSSRTFVAAGWGTKILNVLQSAGITKVVYDEQTGERKGYNEDGVLLLHYLH